MVKIHPSLECGMCDVVLSSYSSRDRHHESIHYGIRYACHLCPVRFTQPVALSMHLRKWHKFTDMVPASSRVHLPELATHPMPAEKSTEIINPTDKNERKGSEDEFDNEECLLVPLTMSNKRKAASRQSLTDRQDGIIKWTDERSLQLLRAIQANLIVLNVGKRGAGKAWERVHEMMMDTGLPQCTTKALKKRWERMRNNHKYSFDDYRKQSSKKVTNVEPLGVLDHAIRELYQNYFATDHAQKRIRAEPDDERHDTPTKKTKIRPTSAANDEDQSKAAMPQLITKTPVVGLERLNMSESTVLPVPRQQSTASSDANATSSATALGEVQLTGSASVDCGTNVYERKLAQLQVEAAQQDVLFKKAQLEHEKKRAEFERQLQQKQLQILDLEAQKVRMMMEMMQHDRDRANLNG